MTPTGLTLLRYRRYPSYQWGEAIAEILKTIDLAPSTAILDAPCGDGVVCYWLVRAGVRGPFELYDISDGKLRHARRLATWAEKWGVRMVVEKRDLFEPPPPSSSEDDVWLLVNSLFLFERFDAVVERMRPRAKHIVGIFPNVTRPDYLSYVKRNPGFNVGEMNEVQTTSFFAAQGYELRHRREITFIPTRGIRPDFLRQGIRLVIGSLERFYPHHNGLYWVGVFRRVG